MIDGQSELAERTFPDQNPTLADSDQVKLILCIVFHRTDQSEWYSTVTAYLNYQ